MILDPTITADTEPYWRGTRSGKLLLPTCANGHAPRFWLPAFSLCPTCRSDRVAWREVASRGTLIAWVTYQREFSSAFPPPYTIAMVELNAGPRMCLYMDQPVERLRVGAVIDIDFQSLAGNEFMPVGRTIEGEK